MSLCPARHPSRMHWIMIVYNTPIYNDTDMKTVMTMTRMMMMMRMTMMMIMMSSRKLSGLTEVE